ncbi:MAG: FMN-binding negative transcriptional regulator [Betaproteobacteria bacterium]|nr:FMN-binding negative transcriptional regulator [Betaproteobacteria bacterium]
MTFYVPAHFRVDDPDTLDRFLAANAFGALVSAGASGLSVSHIPFVPERGSDGRLRLLGHVARANAHWQELEAAGEVVAMFEGPHAYVSPGWYAHHPSVPTWNYAVVHARGRARLLPSAALPALLDRLSRTYEDARTSPWRMDSLPAEYTAKLLDAIVGFEISVDRLDGKFKLSQNRRREDIEGVAAALDGEGQGALAALMRAHAIGAAESR